jgi:hypothetical protein
VQKLLGKNLNANVAAVDRAPVGYYTDEQKEN